MNKDELKKAIEKHLAWLRGDEGGARVVLQGADLRGADLRGADLQDAVLRGAVLQGADLRDADLRGADLQDADLQRADLRGAVLQDADLRGADLQGAVLRGAVLQGADLRGAVLQGADLRDADLQDADLQHADLRHADLQGADLRGAGGISAWRYTPLRFLYDQPSLIHAYKLVRENGEGPFNGGIIYAEGQECAVANANRDENVQCAAGINLATMDWCLSNWEPGYRILVAEFTAADIAAIPHATDGKFRVTRCKIVGEKNLAELGIEVQEA